jgi:hypothetical protein
MPSDQEFCKMVMNWSCSNQKFSNLKIWGLGTLVQAEITHGVWSEVSLERADTIVLGIAVVQAFEVKNQSSLSRRGYAVY